MRQSFYFTAPCLALASLLSGCVAVDPRVDIEPVNKDATRHISGRFNNTASYYSDTPAGIVGSKNFTAALGMFGRDDADSFTVLLNESNDLIVEIFKQNEKVAERVFHAKDGLKFTSDGRIELFSHKGCGGSGDSIQLGCSSKTREIFINPDGDLVTVDSGGGAGLLAIFPMWVYAKLISIFPKIK